MTSVKRGQTRVSYVDLPENIIYVDTGCEVSASCLACTLPMCKFDDPTWYQALKRQDRDDDIIDRIDAEGLTISEAAKRYRLAPRTIARVLQRRADGQRVPYA